MQPENGTGTMLCKIIVASTRVLVDFKEQLGGPRKGKIFLVDHIVNHGQPSIYLV